MKPQVYYDNNGTKLTQIKTSKGELNWFFLPGGPGFDASYFSDLTKELTLPGTLWHIDLPGSGSNVKLGVMYQYDKWGDYLLDLIKKYDNVILIGHSFGGTLILSTPALEKHLHGLILMNTIIGSISDLQQAITNKIQGLMLPNDETMRQLYLHTPSMENYNNLLKTIAPYFFCPEVIQRGYELLLATPLSQGPLEWANQSFLLNYRERWVPQNLTTLILGGDKDYRTPFDLFKNDKRFKRDNIRLHEIEEAGHFPWIEQPDAVKQAFTNFSKSL